MKTLDKLHVIEEAQTRNEARDRAYTRRNADTEAEIRIWCHGGRRRSEIFYTADLALLFTETNVSVIIGPLSIGKYRNYYEAVETALLLIRPTIAESDAMTGTCTAIYAVDDTGYREWIGGAMPTWEGASA